MHQRGKKSRLLAAIVALTLSGAAGASVMPLSTAELLQQPGYRQAWQNALEGEGALPAWISQGRGTSAPPEQVSLQGQNYLVGNVCQPHNCGNQFMYVALSADRHHAWAVNVTLEDRPEAVEHPARSASYRWFGKPDESIKALLKSRVATQLNADTGAGK